MRTLVAAMWLLLPLMVVGLHVVIRAHALVDEDDSVRDEHIAHFLDARKQLSPLCLYIFDRTKRLPEYEKNSTATPHGSFFEDHLPGVCPFGDLQFDSALVTTLNTEAHSYQLGVRIERDPGNSTKRIQIASTDIVPVDDFYNLAVIASDRNENTGKRSGGITFEIVVRRRSPEDDNTEMTLFSIANLYSGCVDRGFRVDVDKDRKLVLLYYLPMVDGDKEGSCYEQRLISDQKVLFTDMRTACLFPKSSPSPEGNPPVSIVVTIDPSSSPGLWNTEFLLSYSDPTTMERVSCRVSAQQNPPRDASVQKQRLRGNYRLYIGNNPHNVSSPKVPRPMVPRRQFRPFGSDDTPQTAMGQLRDTLLTKLMTIEGPRIPQAMRIFGDKSFSLSIFGIELPPMNEDTPFAYLRGKLKDFLVMNGDKMVDGLINMLRKMQPIMDKVEQTPGERLVQRWIDQQENDTKFQFYPDAQVSSFDLFHFAIYKKALTPDELDAGNWTQPTALRRFRAPSREIRIREDEVVLVDLLDLHSVFDDLTLELRALPEFGKLMLYPNKTVVTTENMAAFRELPLPYQKKIFYQPNPDESNENIQLPNPIALSRRRRPYSTIEFGIWKSLTGRPFNATATASIHIFVDAVNDPPRPLKPVLEVSVATGVPILLELMGEDVDGSPHQPSKEEQKAAKEQKENISLEDKITDAFDFSEMTPPPPPPPQQVLKIIRMPQYGKLYDRHLATQNESLMFPLARNDRGTLEKYRIASNDIAKRTFSTDLVYVHGGWDRHETGDSSRSLVVDELWYQLNDGEEGVYSEVAAVQFVLDSSWSQSNENALKILQLKEDTSIVIMLAEIEPLVGLLDSRSKFHVTELPLHGGLYQYHAENEAEGLNASLSYRIGKRIGKNNSVVADMNGRLVYVPDRDYFNMLPPNDSAHTLPTSFGLDHFVFEPVNATEHIIVAVANRVLRDNTFKTMFPFNALQPRVVQFQVINQPDELTILPPVHFVTNQTQAEPVPVPVLFDDPDALYSGQYQVQLKASNLLSRFELGGSSVSNDDVMKFCNYTRPCFLVRSINKNQTSEEATQVAGDEVEENTLTYLVQHALFSPSHIAVLGSKSTLQKALAELTFRDSGISWGKAYRAHFKVTIARVDENGTRGKETSANLFVDYRSWSFSDIGDMMEKIVGMMLNQVEELIWTLVMTVLVCVLITNASCFTSGFCCCCSGARQHRRRRIEDEQTQFVQLVAQNDHEYSVLLMDIADMVLDPNLVFATCLVQCLRLENGSRSVFSGNLEGLCLRSLIPVLESEHQATRFVFRLMVIEFEETFGSVRCKHSSTKEIADFQRVYLAESTCAGQALMLFCKLVGRDWLRCLMDQRADGLKMSVDASSALFAILLEKMSYAVADIPVEIVVLCRACAKLFHSEGSSAVEPSTSLFRSIHVVFFNHFIGPALRFGGQDIFGCNPTPAQRQHLIEMACHFTQLTQAWDLPESSSNDDEYALFDEGKIAYARDLREQQNRYELLLYTIATSSTLHSSFDPSETVHDNLAADIQNEVDAGLMAMCLANVHSFLDAFLPQFENEHKQVQKTRVHYPDVNDDAESLLVRLRRLMKALSFPSISVFSLLEHSSNQIVNGEQECYLASPFTGLSFQEWTEFTTQHEATNCRFRFQTRHDLPRHAEMETTEKNTLDGVLLNRSCSLLTVHIDDHQDEEEDAY